MMYQTVGSSAVEYIAKAMDLPFFVGTTVGEGRSTNIDYTPTQVPLKIINILVLSHV